MKKLTSDEQRALIVLAKVGSIVPGDAADGEFGSMLVGLLRSLVRKGRATATDTQDGPRWTINAAGRAEADGLGE